MITYFGHSEFRVLGSLLYVRFPRYAGMQAMEVRILGAGPAGLSAAITAVRRGNEAVVYERRADCGGRFNGDLQGLENWSSKIDVLEEFESRGIRTSEFYTAPFRELLLTEGRRGLRRVETSRPMFYLVKRGIVEGSIDQGLKKQAIEMGVRIEFNSRKTEKDVDIVATGPRRERIVAVDKGIVFSTSVEDIAVALINDKAAYKAYAYLLVTGGYGCMCTVVFGDLKKLDESFEETVRAFRGMFRFEVKNPVPVGGSASFYMGADGFVRDGRFYAGEAAGLQDAAFGFGIRSAVISGSMATESLIDGKDYKKEARGRYRRYMEATFTLRLLWEHGLARIYPDLYNAAGKINKEMPLWLSGLFYRDTLINRGLFPLAQRILGDRREEGRSATGVEGSKAFME